jgi:hypothetical protein
MGWGPLSNRGKHAAPLEVRPRAVGCAKKTRNGLMVAGIYLVKAGAEGT